MEIYSFLPFCVLRIVKLVFIFVTMSNTLLPRFQEEAQSLFIMERFYKKSLIFSLLLIGIFQFVFAQNGTYSKRYYKHASLRQFGRLLSGICSVTRHRGNQVYEQRKVE